MFKSEPGDIILFDFNPKFWFRHPISWAISKIQGSTITHSGIIIDPKWNLIIDSFYPTVRMAVLTNIIKDKDYKWISVRPINSTKKQRKIVVENALKYIGIKYDFKSWMDLACGLLNEKIFKNLYRHKSKINDNPDKVFCQELVTQCYLSAGIDLAKMMGFSDPSAIIPKDVYNAKNIFTIIELSK